MTKKIVNLPEGDYPSKFHGVQIKNEEELLQFWTSIGGTAGWESELTGEQLSSFLSVHARKVEKCAPAIQQGDWIHKVVIVDAAEIVGYVSVLLSRLPCLRKLRIFACRLSWPFDFNLINAVQPDVPFSKLEHIGLVRTLWNQQQLIELVENIPSLIVASKLLNNGEGIAVYRTDGPAMEIAEQKDLKNTCMRKLEYIDAVPDK